MSLARMVWFTGMLVLLMVLWCYSSLAHTHTPTHSISHTYHLSPSLSPTPTNFHSLTITNHPTPHPTPSHSPTPSLSHTHHTTTPTYHPLAHQPTPFLQVTHFSPPFLLHYESTQSPSPSTLSPGPSNTPNSPTKVPAYYIISVPPSLYLSTPSPYTSFTPSTSSFTSSSSSINQQHESNTHPSFTFSNHQLTFVAFPLHSSTSSSFPYSNKPSIIPQHSLTLLFSSPSSPSPTSPSSSLTISNSHSSSPSLTPVLISFTSYFSSSSSLFTISFPSSSSPSPQVSISSKSSPSLPQISPSSLSRQTFPSSSSSYTTHNKPTVTMESENTQQQQKQQESTDDKEKQEESFLSNYILSILTALRWRNNNVTSNLPYHPLFDEGLITREDNQDNDNSKMLTTDTKDSEQFISPTSTKLYNASSRSGSVNSEFSDISIVVNLQSGGTGMSSMNEHDVKATMTSNEATTTISTLSITTSKPSSATVIHPTATFTSPPSTSSTNAYSTPFTKSTTKPSSTIQVKITPTPKPLPPKFNIPRCCLNQKEEEEGCTPSHTDLNPKASLLPIANGRCGVPSLRPFVYHVIHNLSCPSSSTETSVLGDGNNMSRLVYTNMDVYLSVNQVLIKNFCVDTNHLENDSSSSSNVWIVSCKSQQTPSPRRCEGATCFKKCCPNGFALENHSTCACHEGSSYLPKAIMSLGILEGPGHQQSLQTSDFGFPSCTGDALTIISYKHNESKVQLLAGGSISVGNESEVIANYCLDDHLVKPSGDIMALVCRDQSSLTKKSAWVVVRSVLIPAGLVVSCVFLGATLLCHLCVAPLRDLHGLCLAAYVAALLVADATLFLTQALSGYFSPAPCVAIAVILHVAFLSTFFWLNVICYDVWNYVGLTVQSVPLYRLADDLRIFVVYAVYAWGCPLVIGVVAVTIHFLPKHIDWLLRPGFEQNQCWFRDGDEILAYFYGPMGVLCVVNTLLISHAGLRLYCADQRCTCLPPACCISASQALYTTHMTEFWQRFTLFGLMVICWVMEVVSWLVGPGDSELWALTDTLNAFQGVFIFAIFLRSSKKRRLLQEQLAKWSAGAGEKGRAKLSYGGDGKGKARLNPPSLSEALCPTRILGQARQSGVWERVVRWCGQWQSGPPHLTRRQVLNNIIFRMKQESTQDFDNSGFEDESQEMDNEDEGRTVGRDTSGQGSVPQKTVPIWTMPSWKTHWSKSYFPNVFSKSSSDADAFWTHLTPDISDCTLDTNQTDPSRDTVNVSYSSLSTSLDDDSGSGTSSYPATAPSDQRPTAFPGWTFVRQKSWSLGLGEADTPRARGGQVVCQGLTRRDTILH